MIKRRGITLTVMVVTVIIFGILAGTITISTYSTINYSRLSTWVSEITYIQDIVDEQLAKSSALNFVVDEIKIDVSGLTVEEKNEQFGGETIGSDGTVQLFTLDMNKLKILNTRYGNLQVDTDVYALSKQTGKVYYVRGLEAENKMYYSLTDVLKNRFELETSTNNLTSVVFVPNVVGYSNEPITVMVKVPNTYTEIVVTTSNEQITISSAQLKEKTYEYTVNSNLIEGNYIISVSYNDGVQTLTSNYIVNGYDVTSPVIHQPADEDFVYKENGDHVLYYLINVNATDESGIKKLKYAFGEISEATAKEYFKENGNYVIDGKINLDTSITHYTLYAEDNAGNISVLEFENIIPGQWKSSVDKIVDGVPIPKGFTASQATGENIRSSGLVIYEGTEEVTDVNVEEAKRTRNQYVWVPIAREDFNTHFIRQNFGAGTNLSNIVGTNYWEVELDLTNNMPLKMQNEKYVSAATIAEVQAMYASVKKYEGFYIARYEAGVDTQRNSTNYKDENGNVILASKVYSVMGKIPYTYIPWGVSQADDTNGAVEAARSAYPNNANNKTGVISTLTYRVQWDATLQWLLDTKAVDSVTSIDYGNFSVFTITEGALNKGAKYWVYTTDGSGNYQDVQYDANGKSISTREAGMANYWALTTGALEYSRRNNIYDMAGNVEDLTMGGATLYGGGINARDGRGGDFGTRGGSPGTIAGVNNVFGAGPGLGFRVALYIK